MTVCAVAVLVALVAPLSTLAASGAEWSRLSERTRQQVYRMEASVNHVPADPGGRQQAYEDYMATFSPLVRVHGLVPGDTDFGGVRRFYAALFGTMRGSVLVSDELIVAGPMAAQRYHAVGRMSGEFDGARLENRLVALRGQTFFHLGDDGRIIERWSNHDHGYRMSQTLGPEGRAKGDQLARELNGTGLQKLRSTSGWRHSRGRPVSSRIRRVASASSSRCSIRRSSCTASAAIPLPWTA